MTLAKNLSFFVVTLLCLNLISCGNKTQSNVREERSLICSGLDCLSSIDWKILLQGRALPDRLRLNINGSTVIDECISKYSYAVDRKSGPQSIRLNNFFIPTPGKVALEIIDLGEYCDEESTFLIKSDVDFEVTKDLGTEEILINL